MRNSARSGRDELIIAGNVDHFSARTTLEAYPTLDCAINWGVSTISRKHAMGRRHARRSSASEEGSDVQDRNGRAAAKGARCGWLGKPAGLRGLITQGRVEIDRVVVSELGSKVDPLRQEIRVDGVTLHRPKRLYFAVNKTPWRRHHQLRSQRPTTGDRPRADGRAGVSPSDDSIGPARA